MPISSVPLLSWKQRNLAVARLAPGAALRSDADISQASTVLRLVLAFSARHGAAGLSSDATRELQAAGARPRRAALTGVAAADAR